MLDLVELKGAMVTIDAWAVKKPSPQKIVDLGGDYVLPVKGNQGRLEQAVENFFDEHLEDDFAESSEPLRDEEKRHGRLEHRTYFQAEAPETLAGPGMGRASDVGPGHPQREIDGQGNGRSAMLHQRLKRNVKLFARAFAVIGESRTGATGAWT